MVDLRGCGSPFDKKQKPNQETKEETSTLGNTSTIDVRNDESLILPRPHNTLGCLLHHGRKA